MAISDYKIIPFTPSYDDPDISAITRKIIFPVLSSTAETGYLQRRAQWSRPLYEYEINCGYLIPATRKKLVDFILAHKVGVEEFLFQDPFFYSVSKNDFGNGDDSTTTFQLKIVYEYDNKRYSVPARYIKENSETIYIDNVAQDTSTYNLDYETGIITFDTAPDAGSELSADFEFYRKVFVLNSIELAHTNIVVASTKIILREII